MEEEHEIDVESLRQKFVGKLYVAQGLLSWILPTAYRILI